MVLKKSRNGLNTGNTVRKSVSHNGICKSSLRQPSECSTKIDKLLDYLRGLEDDSCFDAFQSTWRMIYLLQQLQDLNSWLFPEADVEYSLDKDNRWLLVERLDSVIEELGSYRDCSFRASSKLTIRETSQAFSSSQTVDLKFVHFEPLYLDYGDPVISPTEQRLLKLYHQSRSQIYHNQRFRCIQRPAQLLVNREEKQSNQKTPTQRVEKLKRMRRYRRRGIKLKTTKHSDPSKSPYLNHMIDLDDGNPHEFQKFSFSSGYELTRQNVHKYQRYADTEEHFDRTDIKQGQRNIRLFCKEVAAEHNQENAARWLQREAKERQRQQREKQRQRKQNQTTDGQVQTRKGGKRAQRKAARMKAQRDEEEAELCSQTEQQPQDQPYIPGLFVEPSKKPSEPKPEHSEQSTAFLTEIKADDYDEAESRDTQRVELWDFIDALLNRPDEGQKVKLMRCKKKQKCSSQTSSNSSQQLAITSKYSPHPPGSTPQQPDNQNVAEKDATMQPSDVVTQKQNTRKKKKQKPKKKTRNPTGSEEKGAQETDARPQRKRKNASKASQFLLPPLTVKLKDSSIRPNSLRKRYDLAYMEGSSRLSRQFWLDLSARLPLHNSMQAETVAVSAFLVFHVHSVKDNHPIARRSMDSNTSSSDNNDSQENGPASASSSLQFSTARLYIKVDLWPDDQKLLQDKFSDKINPHFIYPVNKVVEFFVEVYKSLPQDSISERLNLKHLNSPQASPQNLCQLDWFYSLDPSLDWKYEVLTAQQAHEACSQVTQLRRPSTPGLQQSLRRTSGQVDVNFEMCLASSTSENEECDNVMVILSPCQHAYCTKCLRGHFKVKQKDNPAVLSCPSAGCESVLDPVTCLQVMSLAQYREMFDRIEDRQVEQHPQWQWCPTEGCRRAVKMLGTGLLDLAVTVQCHCGAIWCFSCKKEAHWPASCQQAAMYAQLRESDVQATAISYNMLRTLCIKCSNCNNNLIRPPSVGLSPQCQCQYEFCLKCLDCKDSPLQIPPSVRREKEIAWTAAGPLLLPVLFYRSALYHRTLKDAWSLSEAEGKAGMLAKLVQRSKTRSSQLISAPRNSAVGPLPNQEGMPGDARRNVSSSRGLQTVPQHLVPALDTDKFFLLLVYKFVHHAHFLLEHVYIVLLENSTSERVKEVTDSVIKLEAVASQINKMLSGITYSPSSLVSRLRRLTATGEKHMVAIVTSVRGLQGSTGTSRKSHTMLPLMPPRVSMAPAFSRPLRNDTF